MRNESFHDEAVRCRLLAEEFEGGSQGPFLLRIAQTFDDLAGRDERSGDSIVGPYEKGLTRQELPVADTLR